MLLACNVARNGSGDVDQVRSLWQPLLKRQAFLQPGVLNMQNLIFTPLLLMLLIQRA